MCSSTARRRHLQPQDHCWSAATTAGRPVRNRAFRSGGRSAGGREEIISETTPLGRISSITMFCGTSPGGDSADDGRPRTGAAVWLPAAPTTVRPAGDDLLQPTPRRRSSRSRRAVRGVDLSLELATVFQSRSCHQCMRPHLTPMPDTIAEHFGLRGNRRESSYATIYISAPRAVLGHRHGRDRPLRQFLPLHGRGRARDVSQPGGQDRREPSPMVRWSAGRGVRASCSFEARRITTI